MRYINNINNSKSIIKPDRIYFLLYLISIPVINPLTAFNGIIYNKYGYKTAQRNIIRWMNRNGCVMIPENYPYKSAILYAATISDMNGFMTGLKKEVIRYIGYNNERKYSSLYYDRNKDRITEKEEDYITHMLDISEFNIKSNGVYESNSNKDNNIFINIQNPQGIYDMLEGTKDECEVVIYCDPDETLEYKLYIPKIIHYEHMYYNVGITVGREYSPDMFYKLKRNLHNKIKDFKEPVNYGDNILNIK
jgi:hypothetical protein